MNRNQQNQQNQPGLQEEIVHWYRGIPPCTKFLFTAFVAVTMVGNFGLINPVYLIFWPKKALIGLEIWRLFTSFFLEALDLGSAIQLYFMYTYSKDLETTRFAGRTADYAFFLLFEGVSILTLACLKNLELLNQSLVMSIIYLWSQYYGEMTVSFMFGLRFKGRYLPFVLLAFETLNSRGTLPWTSIIGLFTGYMYQYLTDIYPANGGRRLLTTPRWLYRLFPSSNTPIQSSFGTIYPGRPNPANGYNWGRGQRLNQQ